MLSDREVWQRGCAGDRDCFGLLFDRHAGAVQNYLFRRLGDWATAEDLTSAVFLLAWRRRREVVIDRDSVLPWLLGVARHAAAHHRRTLVRHRRAVARLMPREEMPDHAEDVSGRVDDERAMIVLRRELRRLPRHQREVVELCLWAGLDHQAAATVLGVAPGTVKSRLSRARRRLNQALPELRTTRRDPAPSSLSEPTTLTRELA